MDKSSTSQTFRLVSDQLGRYGRALIFPVMW